MMKTLLLCAVGAILVSAAGCSSSETGTTDRKPPAKTPKNAPLKVYEQEFTPSKYDTDIAVVESSSHRYTEKPPDTTASAAPQTMTLVPGYRVQVMFSGSIDEATKVKNEVGLLFPTDIVYMIYDSPYYKVRLGDYQERSDAARAMKVLLEKGYSQAWIVPDRVQSHPLKPIMPPPPDIK